MAKKIKKKKVEKEQVPTYDCECLRCGFTLTSEKHCRDITCPECGGQMRRAERPGPGAEDGEQDTPRRPVSVRGIRISYKPWGEVQKNLLPADCFFNIGDRSRPATWSYPYREGAGGIDSDTGRYRRAGPINWWGVAAALAAAHGARTGTPAVPELRRRIEKLAGEMGIGVSRSAGVDYIVNVQDFDIPEDELHWYGVAPMERQVYVRYVCRKCKHTHLRVEKTNLPLTMFCSECTGIMQRKEKTVRKRKNEKVIAEPGIDWGTPQTKWISVMQSPRHLCKGDWGTLTLSRDAGVRMTRCQDVEGKWITHALLFQKEKGWDNRKIRKWIKDHGFIVMEINNLISVRYVLRKLLNNRMDLIQEWRQYYIDAIDDPHPTLVAWSRFKQKYTKTPGGRWTLKD